MFPARFFCPSRATEHSVQLPCMDLSKQAVNQGTDQIPQAHWRGPVALQQPHVSTFLPSNGPNKMSTTPSNDAGLQGNVNKDSSCEDIFSEGSLILSPDGKSPCSDVEISLAAVSRRMSDVSASDQIPPGMREEGRSSSTSLPLSDGRCSSQSGRSRSLQPEHDSSCCSSQSGQSNILQSARSNTPLSQSHGCPCCSTQSGQFPFFQPGYLSVTELAISKCVTSLHQSLHNVMFLKDDVLNYHALSESNELLNEYLDINKRTLNKLTGYIRKMQPQSEALDLRVHPRDNSAAANGGNRESLCESVTSPERNGQGCLNKTTLFTPSPPCADVADNLTCSSTGNAAYSEPPTRTIHSNMQRYWETHPVLNSISCQKDAQPRSGECDLDYLQECPYRSSVRETNEVPENSPTGHTPDKAEDGLLISCVRSLPCRDYHQEDDLDSGRPDTGSISANKGDVDVSENYIVIQPLPVKADINTRSPASHGNEVEITESLPGKSIKTEVDNDSDEAGHCGLRRMSVDPSGSLSHIPSKDSIVTPQSEQAEDRASIDSVVTPQSHQSEDKASVNSIATPQSHQSDDKAPSNSTVAVQSQPSDDKAPMLSPVMSGSQTECSQNYRSCFFALGGIMSSTSSLSPPHLDRCETADISAKDSTTPSQDIVTISDSHDSSMSDIELPAMENICQGRDVPSSGSPLLKNCTPGGSACEVQDCGAVAQHEPLHSHQGSQSFVTSKKLLKLPSHSVTSASSSSDSEETLPDLNDNFETTHGIESPHHTRDGNVGKQIPSPEVKIELCDVMQCVTSGRKSSCKSCSLYNITHISRSTLLVKPTISCGTLPSQSPSLAGNELLPRPSTLSHRNSSSDFKVNGGVSYPSKKRYRSFHKHLAKIKHFKEVYHKHKKHQQTTEHRDQCMPKNNSDDFIDNNSSSRSHTSKVAKVQPRVFQSSYPSGKGSVTMKEDRAAADDLLKELSQRKCLTGFTIPRRMERVQSEPNCKTLSVDSHKSSIDTAQAHKTAKSSVTTSSPRVTSVTTSPLRVKVMHTSSINSDGNCRDSMKHRKSTDSVHTSKKKKSSDDIRIHRTKEVKMCRTDSKGSSIISAHPDINKSSEKIRIDKIKEAVHDGRGGDKTENNDHQRKCVDTVMEKKIDTPSAGHEENRADVKHQYKSLPQPIKSGSYSNKLPPVLNRDKSMKRSDGGKHSRETLGSLLRQKMEEGGFREDKDPLVSVDPKSKTGPQTMGTYLRGKLPSCPSPEVIGPMNKRGFQFTEECLHMVEAVYNLEESERFCGEIKSQDVSDYHIHVKQPMWLDLIASRLRRRTIASLDEFVSSMRRIFWNCRLYYKDPKSKARLDCDEVERFFEKLLIETFPDENFHGISGRPPPVRPVVSQDNIATKGIATPLRELFA